MKQSKAQNVLFTLQQAGDRGIHSFDLQPIGGWRYAARINDLKKQGYSITAIPEKRGESRGVRYFLQEIN